MTSTVQGAEESALRELWDDHAGALFGYALRLTAGDRGRAEDIVQETLVRAWRIPAALEARRGPVRPWLFTVAHRVAVDGHRRRAARPDEVGGPAVENVLQAVPDSGDVDAELDRIVVADALAALSEEHREVIVQTYYAGRSLAETAERLGIPQGTVKSRSFYALKALRLALTERGVST